MVCIKICVSGDDELCAMITSFVYYGVRADRKAAPFKTQLIKMSITFKLSLATTTIILNFLLVQVGRYPNFH